MKKITFSFLAMVLLVGSAYSQLNYNLVAPANNNATSAFRPLNGSSTSASQKSVLFIHKSELLPMNLATINSVDFQYLAGTGSIPVAGNFTLYLQNTTDTDLLKPNSFSAITATLAPSDMVYTGTYTVPAAAGAATVPITLTTPFNYTGGGLYVLWNFESTGPFAAAQASLSSNNARTDWHYYNTSSGAPVNTFTTGVFRPSLVFHAVNTATNEIEVLSIKTPGKISKLETSTNNVFVTLVNSSIGAQTNVNVTLNATGANPITTSSIIANFPAGAVTTLTFAYNAPASGLSNIVAAAVFPDQNINNNAKATTQSVTCNEIALAQPTVPVVDYTSLTTGNGIISTFLHRTGSTASSITAVSVVIPSFTAAANSGKQVYPVVTDFNGAIIATGNTLTIGAANMGVLQPLTFANPVALTPNTQYLFGVGTTTSGYFPVGTIAETNVDGYYIMPLGGGTPVVSTSGYLSLEATLLSSAVAITASATKTIVCKKDGPNTVTLTASGLSTYTWTPGGSGTSIVVTPTVAGASGGHVFSVIGTDAASGCKSANASITISVSACTALSSNTADGYDLKLFPNPAANGKSTITGLSGTNVVTVFNTLGQVVLTNLVSGDTMSLDLSNQPSGNYLVKITNSNSESRTIKVVNQN